MNMAHTRRCRPGERWQDAFPSWWKIRDKDWTLTWVFADLWDEWGAWAELVT